MAERDPDTPYLRAVHAQRLASDPSRTRLVSANAGSGKTKVLVDRVSRLLLAGVRPEKILCLTYTKAAAAEMQARLFATLGGWSVLPDEELRDVLLALAGDGEVAELRKARSLFAAALETPEGLKVQTLHAFSAQVLKRFPMEAGILPGFDQIDDAGELALKEEVRRRLLHEAWYSPRSELAQQLSALARDTADQTLDALFAWMGANVREIGAYATPDGMERLAGVLGVEPDACEVTLTEAAWEATPVDALRSHLGELLAGPSTLQKVAQKVQAALEASVSCPLTAWSHYRHVFLTKSFGHASSVVNKTSPAHLVAFYGTKGEADTPEALRVRHAHNTIAAATVLDSARKTTGLAAAYAQAYVKTKRERRLIDFNDQIQRVHDLLNRSEAADWVRYKLDGGIDHILVDEAQDTSDLQWGIVDALREGFDPPDERGQSDKTFFAVGDEKQSIYGFQGAKPSTFIARINREPEAGVRMGMSFRSAPDILKAVDATFVDHGAGERMFDVLPEGEAADSSHSAHRDDRGRVELWPVAPPAEDPPDEVAWKPEPVDALGQTHPKEVLAKAIAVEVARWLREGETVFDRTLEGPDGKKGATRPMRAGDILILVRQRNDFFGAVIRHLKAEGVAVAGADRLVLSEATVVRDLLALAKWALFPGDSLSLAEALKSPLFGYSDDDLFRIAHGRGETWLWHSLLASPVAQDVEAGELLAAIMASVGELAPYEFFTRMLDRTLDGVTLRRRIENRLGVEARDPLTEFLGQVLAFQRRTSASLQHFVQEWEGSEFELKREQEGQAREVRIMTVHGAKGLESPVVILPQTTGAPGATLDRMMDVEGVFVPTPSKSTTPPALAPYREAMEREAKREHLRLLYVAMTRAESRLVVCGYPPRKNAKAEFHDESWYAEVKAGLDRLDCTAVDTPFGEGKMFGAPAGPPVVEAPPEATTDASLPDWVGELAARERRPAKRVVPSHLLDDSRPGAVRSPLARTDRAERERRFLRGNLIHRLLQMLPDIAPAQRQAVMEDMLVTLNLSEPMQARIVEEVTTVLERFPEVFAPGSQAEVSLAGVGKDLPDDMLMNAQIDRLAVTPDRVVIVDYKSNRPPPKTQDKVSPQYMAQMAAYRELAREIWPDREVVCALLWTDSAEMMELEGARLDAALEAVRERLSTS